MLANDMPNNRKYAGEALGGSLNQNARNTYSRTVLKRNSSKTMEHLHNLWLWGILVPGLRNMVGKRKH